MSWQNTDKETMADKDISEAIAKLYTRKQEILPATSVSGELPSYSIILPLNGTWLAESIDYPNAPPASLRDSVSKQWWEGQTEENSNESNPNAGHVDSATPKNVIIKNHQVSTQNLYQPVILLLPLASCPSRQSWPHLPLALHQSVSTVVCVPQPHSTAPSGPSSDHLSIGKYHIHVHTCTCICTCMYHVHQFFYRHIAVTRRPILLRHADAALRQ